MGGGGGGNNWGGGGYGYGGNFGYNDYGYDPGYSSYYSDYYTSDYAPVTSNTIVTDTTAPGFPGAPVQLAQIDGISGTDATVRAQSPDDEDDFATRGEQEFKAGQYDRATKSWKHAVLDDPENGVLLMLLSQSMFAEGKFNEAAGALQRSLMSEDPENWGVVTKNYRELYTNIGDYTTQLRVLEKARKEKPEEPGLRFLLGYHYGYLGYPEDAIVELDKAIELAPEDELSTKLRDAFKDQVAKKSGAKPAAPAVPVAPPQLPQP